MRSVIALAARAIARAATRSRLRAPRRRAASRVAGGAATRLTCSPGPDHDVLVGQHGRRQRRREPGLAELADHLLGGESHLRRRSVRGLAGEVDDRELTDDTRRARENERIVITAFDRMPHVDNDEAI